MDCAIILVQPYEVLPKLRVIRLVHICVLWLNAFPNKLGIPRVHSPQEIVTGQSLPWDKHCKACFGDFIQAPYDHKGPGMPTYCVNEM